MVDRALYFVLSASPLRNPPIKRGPRGPADKLGGGSARSENIFIRVQRVISGGVNSATAAVERASGASLMRQAILEVDLAIEEVQSKREAAEDRRSHAMRQQAIIKERLATLQDQARFAVGKDRDDLAQAAISRTLDYEAEAKRLRKVQAESAEEIERLEESHKELKVRKAQMEKDFAAFQEARRAAREEEAGAPPRPEARAERRADRAEAAFERAMASAGGLSVGLMNADEAAKVAEVDTLRREHEIAERLKGFREAADAVGAEAPAPRKKAAGGKR